jgi:hypothetical protein
MFRDIERRRFATPRARFTVVVDMSDPSFSYGMNVTTVVQQISRLFDLYDGWVISTSTAGLDIFVVIFQRDESARDSRRSDRCLG